MRFGKHAGDNVVKTRSARRYRLAWLFMAFCVLLTVGLAGAQEVDETMDALVTRLCYDLDEDALSSLTHTQVLELLTDDEREALATRYWRFDVNVPVVVSVIRTPSQRPVPFWIEEQGFQKTDYVVTSGEYGEEIYTYEVWQKDFEPGTVGLGINGFGMHRSHYLVAVGARESGTEPRLSKFYPEDQQVFDMTPGAPAYHDWTELRLIKVPEALEGHKLLTTIRGRAREAHIVGAFRKTPFPSSGKPDQIVLTWQDDPSTTQAIQWRTSPEITKSAVRYRKADGGGDWRMAKAECKALGDRLLLNDRFVHHWTASLGRLEPATEYVYQAGSLDTNVWSGEYAFRTGPDGPAPFTFVYLGDTHRSKTWGEVLAAAFERHPETAFYAIAGDIVSTGLFRDDWDQFFEYGSPILARRPLAPAIGNHDDQDGLGAGLYLDVFALPGNGPEDLEPERCYALRYGNALLLVVDHSSLEPQRTWLEQQLSKTDATWKFAMFHFPPYVPHLDYKEIREQWGAVFDKYHLDMAFSGHVHFYLRTKPIRDGEVVDSHADGTVYVTSVTVPSREKAFSPPPYAAAHGFQGRRYQTIRIDGNRLEYSSRDISGEVLDSLTITK